ncbi:MAG: hypothetical protein HY763_05850 [Planctomycetes bacterium]|nr:hypothetical protein [Planctomycetota bacterium]
MKKLLAQYKNLPPELKMMLAMAGLGSPLGAIWLLKRYVFPGASTTTLIFGVAAVVALISLVGFFISKGFKRGASKRTQRLASDLAREDQQGLMSMDVRAAIKANNEKFFTAIRDMKKNLNISVYDLPWYIVIGDSGCGKTRLINNGGLTFSTGKPEGYQLGTLNYNWWFTEDAVFVDMAGRLCNPQEDADHREWQAFLDTVARGRKGFPINGAIVCVSAEHLLQDPAEKHEADANTMLERLRETQTRLGVTFATYLVVTKCDKILGFMQFFDRAEKDIVVKHQMFGWSKPGPFNELYDPDRFKYDFEELYGRLNDLRLRRLHDDIGEIDLGLAYSFPEEFRELRDPLNTYTRTLFPMIKNPRAVKNLIFRGIYFTSATQEGEVILKHLTERLGAEVAGQFPSLDTLYPQKKPLFVKDVLFRKVFPEHGLVFRHEDDVIRNRKLGQILKYGSVALALVLVFIVVWSARKVDELVTKPRTHTAERCPPASLDTKEAAPRKPDDPLRLCEDLDADARRLEQNRLPAALLSLSFSGTRHLIRDIQAIRVRVFEEHVLGPALGDIQAALRDPKLPVADGSKELEARGKDYVEALGQYLTWLGCIDAPDAATCVTYDSFKTLAKVPGLSPQSVLIAKTEVMDRQASGYFTAIRQEATRRNPLDLLKADRPAAERVVVEAVKALHAHMKGYTDLAKHPNPTFREWMRIRTACSELDKSYAEMLGAAASEPTSLEALAKLKEQFVAQYTAFTKALADCTWKGDRIRPLRDLIREERNRWIQLEAGLAQAYGKCTPTAPKNDAVTASAKVLSAGDGADVPGLDAVLWKSLLAAGLTKRDYVAGCYDELDKLVLEVEQVCEHVLARRGDPTAPEGFELTPAAGFVRDKLALIKSDIDKIAPGADAAKAMTPTQWADVLDAKLNPRQSDDKLAVPANLHAIWQGDKLKRLYEARRDLIDRGETTSLLLSIRDRSRAPARWGIAELFPLETWGAPVASAFTMELPEAAAPDQRRRGAATQEAAPEKETPEPPRRRARGTAEPTPATTPTPSAPSPRPRADTTGRIPTCATRTFLQDRMLDCADVYDFLKRLDPGRYYGDSRSDTPLHLQCAEDVAHACRTYVATYVSAWKDAYDRYSYPELLETCTESKTWQELATRLASAGRGSLDKVEDQLTLALSAALEAGPFWDQQMDSHRQWSEACPPNDKVCELFAGWTREEFKKSCPKGAAEPWGSLYSARLPERLRKESPIGAAPWSVLADAYARQRWRDLAKAITANGSLRTRFETADAALKPGTPVPWGAVQELRSDTGLAGERITSGIVEFEACAQKTLSREISGILADIQNAYFTKDAPVEGWPYTTPETAGAPPRTVNFEDFQKFLAEVGRAQAYFEPLEQKLPPDDPLHVARKAFYAGCRAWMDFITDDGTTKDRGGPRPKPLEVTIEEADPLDLTKGGPCAKDPIQNRPAYYYNHVALELNLELLPAGAAQGDFRRETLLMSTLTQIDKVELRKGRWTWPGDIASGRLGVKLTGGRNQEGTRELPPDFGRELNEGSPLAFCVYLYHYGTGAPKGDLWTVCHGFDLVAEFKNKQLHELVKLAQQAGNTQVGDKFIFTLSRPMPPPIKKLEKP